MCYNHRIQVVVVDTFKIRSNERTWWMEIIVIIFVVTRIMAMLLELERRRKHSIKILALEHDNVALFKKYREHYMGEPGNKEVEAVEAKQDKNRDQLSLQARERDYMQMKVGKRSE